ncbi:MAG TPA: 50S ribosomal protein L21e [Candidatus Lokiarchaeia archaeon]|nr:50S ribosomal protein L21e [Candidatus Lokiarchaeia archaeon]
MGRTMGNHRKCRHVLRKNPRKKGMAPLGRYLQDFEVGDTVDIIIDPSQMKAMPHKRFQGKTGRIVSKRGRCFEIEIKQIHKMKHIFVSVAHMRINALNQQIRAQRAQEA